MQHALTSAGALHSLGARMCHYGHHTHLSTAVCVCTRRGGGGGGDGGLCRRARTCLHAQCTAVAAQRRRDEALPHAHAHSPLTRRRHTLIDVCHDGRRFVAARNNEYNFKSPTSRAANRPRQPCAHLACWHIGACVSGRVVMQWHCRRRRPSSSVHERCSTQLKNRW